MYNKPLFSQLYKGHARRLYECCNPMCFYSESLMGVDEVTWKEQWNSDVEDLDMVPRCPSCAEPLAFWDYETEAEMERDKCAKEKEYGQKTT
jgi:hypothetical protein